VLSPGAPHALVVATWGEGHEPCQNRQKVKLCWRRCEAGTIAETAIFSKTYIKVPAKYLIRPASISCDKDQDGAPLDFRDGLEPAPIMDESCPGNASTDHD
jgi:hypothetical protein